MFGSSKRPFLAALGCAVLAAAATLLGHLMYRDGEGGGADVLWMTQLGLAVAALLLGLAGVVGWVRRRSSGPA